MKAALNTLAFAALAIANTSARADQPSSNSAKLTAHLQGLQTENATECMNGDKVVGPARIVICRAALEELEDSRLAAKTTSRGELANFDFQESVVQSGLLAAYIGVDNQMSSRVCTVLERIWVLRHGLLSVPQSEVSASAYSAFHDLPAALGSALTTCRGKFGTPKDAPPMPQS